METSRAKQASEAFNFICELIEKELDRLFAKELLSVIEEQTVMFILPRKIEAKRVLETYEVRSQIGSSLTNRSVEGYNEVLAEITLCLGNTMLVSVVRTRLGSYTLFVSEHEKLLVGILKSSKPDLAQSLKLQEEYASSGLDTSGYVFVKKQLSNEMNANSTY